MESLTKHRVRSVSTAIRPQSWQGSRKQALWTLLLLCAVNWVTALNPKDDFCRRFAHQSTVIDDKLYIDGGWVNFNNLQQTHKNYSNTWLAYHDLNHVDRSGESWPDLNIGLSKNHSIPTVHGGVLWGDNIHKRFYLYGGEWNSGFPKDPYHLLSYDILHDKWDDFGTPDIKPPLQIASYGAGVGVSGAGMGYYLGGWISNASMSGWTKSRTMSSSFYSFAYGTGKFTKESSPDENPRAEGGMVWIPVGDGMLVYMGGMLSLHGNGTVAPQSFDEVLLFDGSSWLTQSTTGEIPPNRRQFCIDVAWAPDKSTFNIYMSGGLSVPPPVVNTTAFNDIYILTLPSFIWVKAYPTHFGNATLGPIYGLYGSSCNMVKHMSQMFVIGGNYPDTDNCDLAEEAWGMHNFWTGTYQNDGDNDTYWALYDPNITSNVVPIDVFSVTGGTKYGGATILAPKGGFDKGNEGLRYLFAESRSSSEQSPTPTAAPGPALSAGDISAIAIGGAVGLALVLFVWFCFGRGVLRRRKAQRRSQMTQLRPLCISELVAPLPPSELPAGQDGNMRVTSELPEQRVNDKGAVFPTDVSSTDGSPGPVHPQLVAPLAPSELPAGQDGNIRATSKLPEQRVNDKGVISPPGIS